MWSVFFVFLSYLDGHVVEGVLDTEKESEHTFSMVDGTFCAKMSIVGENLLYKVSDGAEVVRSVVSPAGKLVNCSITVDHVQVKTFMQECVLGLRGHGRQLDARFTRMDEARIMCRELTERSEVTKTEGSDASEDKVVKRAKRGFTYPGTLWCGAGNMADSYDQLGQFADTDSCCRTHDHCPHVIHAFSSNYGHTNFKWHSICHCDCDNTLKACLRKVNDSSSRVVGQAFFNVIGVPCFEFTYEEQCAERLWYGACKRYEKFPLAVLRDAVPYDSGGIKVIDELTLAPPNTKASSKRKEEVKPESPTQPTMSGPEAPSLTNVVTAAEDFIKVLATVSTSQSSNGESDKGETQSSEKKKKRKNKGKKKKNTKVKGKGKGRKRKLKAEAGVKREEGAVVSPSGSKAEEVKSLSNFLSDSRKHDQSGRDTHRAGDDEYELQGKEEASNQVMKDEPAMEEEATSTAALVTVEKAPAEPDPQVPTGETPPSTTTAKPQTGGQRRGRKKNSKEISPPPSPPPKPPSEELSVATTDRISAVSVFTNATVTPTAQPEQQSIAEIQLAVSTASSPKVIPKVKRNRSKEGGGSERRKKGRKSSSAPLIVASAPQNSSADILPAIPFTGTPTARPVPTRQQQRSHSRSPDVYRGEKQVGALSSSFSLSKWQRSKKKEQRKSRRKALVSPPTANPHFPFQLSEAVSPTPGSSRPEITTARHDTETGSEWRLLTTAAPTVGTKGDRQAARKRTKPREEAAAGAAALSAAAAGAEQAAPVTFTAGPFAAATAAQLGAEKPRATTPAEPTMSPRQWTVEKVKAQFARKKKRKAALLNRQQ